jgi:type I restriction enzyme, S subunit
MMSNLSFLDKLLDGAQVEWKTVDEVFHLRNGYTPSKANTEFWSDGDIPWFRMDDLRTKGRILNDAIQHIHESGVKGKLFPANSIIMATTATIGEHALVIVDYLSNQRFTNFTLRSEICESLDIKFVYYYFFVLDENAKQSVNMSSFPSVQMSELRKWAFPIPPLNVQREIVQILDNFTELTARKKQYNYYRDQLLSFEFPSAGGVPAGRGGRAVEWKALGELAENLDSKRRPITSGLRDAGDIPYYGASGIVDYVKDYIFDGDFLLVSEDGANLLARSTPIAFSVSGKSWVNNHAHVLKFKTYAERRYIEYYLNSIDLTPYISGAAQPKLNQNNLNNIEVPNPSVEEKERIVAILDKFDALTNSITEGLPREIALRQKQYEYYRDLLLSFPKSEPHA